MGRKNGKLTKSERHNLITAKLRGMPALRVSELASDIGVSTETIRRDLAELNERGLISRTYGGAARPLEPEPKYAERDSLYAADREHIAAALCTLINDGEVLIIGSGSTTFHAAVRLAAEKKKLVCFTDSPLIASALAQNPTFKVHLAPGLYSDDEKCVWGAETVNYLNGVFANYAILGCSGFTAEGVSNADADIAQTYLCMVSRASKTIVVADHSKICRDSVSVYAVWNRISRLVTDMYPAAEELLAAIRRSGTEITIASKEWGALQH